MIVRRRFRFLPPVVGSYRFCSLRHASNGFFPGARRAGGKKFGPFFRSPVANFVISSLSWWSFSWNFGRGSRPRLSQTGNWFGVWVCPLTLLSSGVRFFLNSKKNFFFFLFFSFFGLEFVWKGGGEGGGARSCHFACHSGLPFTA